MPEMLTLTVAMPAAEATAFALFLKRTMLDDYRAKCAPHAPAEAELMQSAGERLRDALAAQGYRPR